MHGRRAAESNIPLERPRLCGIVAGSNHPAIPHRCCPTTSFARGFRRRSPRCAIGRRRSPMRRGSRRRETGDCWKIAVAPRRCRAPARSSSSCTPTSATTSPSPRKATSSRPIESFELVRAVRRGRRRRQRRAAALDQPLDRARALRSRRSSRCRTAASGARRAAMSTCMPTLDDDGTELRERRFLPYRR